MKSIFFVLLITISKSYCQQSNYFIVDSATIYKGYFGGGTTANLRRNSNSVDTMNKVSKSLLTHQYLDTLNLLFKESKKGKHIQQKVGPSYYARIYIDGNAHRIAVVPNFGLIDLNTSTQFELNKSPYSDIFKRFIIENYQ